MDTTASRLQEEPDIDEQVKVMRSAFGDAEFADTGLGRYVAWLAERGQRFTSYSELWAWSVEDLEGFWSSIWEFFEVPGSPGNRALTERAMPGTSWFPTARLNYAECVLASCSDPTRIAVVSLSQTRPREELTFGELTEQVRLARSAFRSLGVSRGDVVAGYLPSVPEAVVAMLAAASLGAAWACCPPEFGARSVIDRLAQLRPKVLIAVSGYRYGTKQVDKTADLETIRASLPSVGTVIGLTYGVHRPAADHDWRELLEQQPSTEALEFDEVPFDQPLWTLFSSGTTGLPKAVVHSHGGIVLEHLKLHGLHFDTRSGDLVMLMATTGWTVWNAMVSALMLGAGVVLTDGNPHHPRLDQPWRTVAEEHVALFGTSPGFLSACRADGIRPGESFDLSAVRTLSVTGAVLPPDVHDWLYDVLPPDVYVNSQSGGTDICSNFVAGNPWLPVYRGEISGPCLGADVAAFDDDGNEVVGEVGELVVRSPMPSMPVAFWNDKGMKRYRAAYFDLYPGIWRHGDWVTVSERRSFVIHGRSDATLNRGGVRLGTAEFYNLVEGLPEIDDSLVVHLEDSAGGPGELILFVQMAPGRELSADGSVALKNLIRKELSPRHVPDLVAAVPAVPRTLTGKKLETPIKKILAGADPQKVVSPGAVSHFDAIEAFARAARRA